MPRQPNNKITEAEKLYKSGMKMVDIAKQLEVPEGTVRRWKHDKDWEGTGKKKQSERSDKEDNEKANVRKRGAPKGNQNAKGGRGNPSPHKVTKHGAYRTVFMDALDEDELELLNLVPEEEELLLLEEIQIASIRERRVLKAINSVRDKSGDECLADTTKSETKRTFRNAAEKKQYEKKIQDKIEKGERLPGEAYNIQTHNTNKILVIARLEQELSSIQSKKTKAIEALSKIRLERLKLEKEDAGKEVVDDWISAVLGGVEHEE